MRKMTTYMDKPSSNNNLNTKLLVLKKATYFISSKTREHWKPICIIIVIRAAFIYRADIIEKLDKGEESKLQSGWRRIASW